MESEPIRPNPNNDYQEITVKTGERDESETIDEKKNVLRGVMAAGESILRKHNVSIEQLGMLYAAEISEAGRKLGSQSKSKRLAKNLLKEMNAIDGKLQSLGGNFTAKATKKIQDEKIGLSKAGIVDDVINQLTVTGRGGFMTVQAVTTARNTTNGY